VEGETMNSRPRVSEAPGAIPHIEQDPRFQKLDWSLQRAFLVAAAVLLLLAAAGLFGDGPLSRRRMMSGDLTITHERFARQSHDTELSLRLHEPMNPSSPADQPAENTSIVLDLRGWLLTDAEPPTFLPEPRSQAAIPGGTRYEFDRTGGSGFELIARVSPDRAGMFKGELTIAGQTFPLSTLVYP
jgi:hypothetical protein